MTDPHHLHLILSHLPVVGVFIGIALLVWGYVVHSGDVKRASLALFVACALGAAATFATGEPSEERVEKLPTVSHDAIERHEDSAKPAAIATYVLGAASLAGLVWVWGFKPRRSEWVYMVAIVLAVVAGVLLARAANLGGLIRHPEVGSPQPAPSDSDDD
jgi:drug/metabolite transporter (DMT)-like permease